MYEAKELKQTRVTIIIVTWNSFQFLYECLESIRAQTFTDFQVMLVDNHSADKTTEFLRSEYPEYYLLQNFNNVGFCRANNQGIRLSSSDYILTLNPDTILDNTFLERIIAEADQHPKGGSFTGKVLKLHKNNEASDLDTEFFTNSKKTNIIDTTGLVVYKNGMSLRRGEGENAQNTFQVSQEIFGVDGACALYRREALEDIKINNEYFDENFFAYKEDVDIAYRLRLYGWNAHYVARATAYHHRYFAADNRGKIRTIKQTRIQKSFFSRMISFKNQHLMLLKNTHWKNFFHLFLPALWRQSKIFFYLLIFEPRVLAILPRLIKDIPSTLQKRKIIMAHAQLKAADIRKLLK